MRIDPLLVVSSNVPWGWLEDSVRSQIEASYLLKSSRYHRRSIDEKGIKHRWCNHPTPYSFKPIPKAVTYPLIAGHQSSKVWGIEISLQRPRWSWPSATAKPDPVTSPGRARLWSLQWTRIERLIFSRLVSLLWLMHGWERICQSFWERWSLSSNWRHYPPPYLTQSIPGSVPQAPVWSSPQGATEPEILSSSWTRQRQIVCS